MSVDANNVTRDLFSSVIEKFNGYEVIEKDLAHKEKEDFFPINIVYEPIYDENVPVPCYFTGQTHLACMSYIGRNVKIKEKLGHLTVRQCHYCKKFLCEGQRINEKSY